MQRKADHNYILNIFLMCSFELIWPGLAMSEQAQLIFDSQENHFYP